MKFLSYNDNNSTFSSLLNNNNNNITINDDDKSNKCDMFGSFAMYVQIVLAGLSFMILICKNTL